MGVRQNIGAIAWVSLLFFLDLGCAKIGLQVEKPVRSAAVIPFFAKTPSETGRRFAEDPISGRLFVAGEIAPNARRELTDLIYRKLATLPQLQLVPRGEVERTMKQEDFWRDPISSAREIGEAFEVEGVVLGWVFRYEERIGSVIAVERPASVSFSIHLFSVEEGRILWTGVFQETQQPLSENILKFMTFLRTRGTWLRAKGLASVGMDEVLVSFPASRERREPEPEIEGP